MQTNNSKYQNNILGLPPSFLEFCERIGRAAAAAYIERQKAINEENVIDTDYEEVKTNLLPQNTQNDE